MLNYEFPWQQAGPIGLDIGRHSVKLVQLMLKQNRLHLVDAGKTQIPSQSGAEQHSKAVITAVKTLLAKGRFKGRWVVSSLPNSMLKITSVRTGESDLVKAEAQLQLEAAYRFGLDPNQDSIRFLPAGAVMHGDRVKQEMILFGARREAIYQHIESLEAMSLQPVSLDPAPCALFRSLLYSIRPASEALSTRVCIEIGYGDSTVVIGRQGEICFVKQLPYGLYQLDNHIAKELGITHKEANVMRRELDLQTQTDASLSSDVHAVKEGNEPTSRQVIMECIRSVGEQLAKEVLLCLRYHSVTFRGESVDGIHVCGGGTYDTSLLSTLGRHLSATPEKIQPFESIKPLSQQGRAIINRIGHEWAVPVGLALKLIQQPEDEKGSMKDTNMEISSKTIV